MDVDWKAFIVAEVIRRALTLSTKECEGCQEELHCASLHACWTTSLVRKLECFLEGRIKPQMLNDLQLILNQFESRFCLMDRRENYIKMGHDFLKDSNAHALYYGRFITKYNDQSICGPCFTPYIEIPNTTKATSVPIDEDTIDKDLMDACEDYDKVILNQPPQKKRKTDKVNDKEIKKIKKSKKSKKSKKEN